MDFRWIDGVPASGGLAGFLDRLRGEVMRSSNILAMIADFAVMMMVVMMTGGAWRRMLDSAEEAAKTIYVAW